MDNNVIKFDADTEKGNSGSNGFTAEWVSIKQDGSESEWVVDSDSTDWRAIKQVTNNLSKGVSLFKVDTNPITVAKGTQIIYVEYLGPNTKCNDDGPTAERPDPTTNDDTITFGLVSNPDVSIDESNPQNAYINYNVSNYNVSNYYGVTKIGGGHSYTESTYGGIDTYAVFGSDAFGSTSNENNPKLYIATYVRIWDNLNFLIDGKYYQSAYTVATSTSDYKWVDYSKHGYIFAAITGEYAVTEGHGAWSEYKIECNENYKYEIEINAYCAATGYEGILVFTREQSKKIDDENKKISEFNDAFKKIDGAGSISFTVEDGGTFYVYFKTSPCSSNGEINDFGFPGFRYASIKITRLINVNVYGNGGTINGEENISLYMAPYKPYPDVLDSRLVEPVVSRNSTTGVDWVSVSGIYESNKVSSPNYNNLVITSSGKFAGDSTEAENNKLLATDSSEIGLCLHWKDAYDGGEFVKGPVSTYCTSAPMISNTTSNEIKLPITDSNYKGVKFASGPVDDYYCDLSYGFKINSDSNGNGAYLTVPSGLSAGKYDLGTVTFSSPGLTYEGVSVSRKLPVINVSSVEAFSTVPNVVFSQSSNIPAKYIRLDSGNLGNYFNVTASQTITYNNGASSIETIDSDKWKWGGSVSIPSKGIITETSSSGFTFNGNECYVELLQPKSKFYISTTASREKNIVENITIYDSNYNNTSILDIGEMIDLDISAHYTSGEYRDLINNIEPGVSFSMIYPSNNFSIFSIL